MCENSKRSTFNLPEEIRFNQLATQTHFYSTEYLLALNTSSKFKYRSDNTTLRNIFRLKRCVNITSFNILRYYPAIQLYIDFI